jgi:hypothetical protein
MKIPKTLIQTNYLDPPKYLIDMNMKFNPEWNYEYYSDDDIINFLKNNPIEEFKNAVEIFNSFEHGAHKADFFRYYYIYLKGGVYSDSDFLITSNLDNVIKDYEFFCVQSMMNDKALFNGFIGASPKNVIIYKALKNLYNLNKDILKNDFFYNSKDLYDIVKNYKLTISNIYKDIHNNDSEGLKEFIDKKIKIYEEQLIKVHNGIYRIHRSIHTLSNDNMIIDSTYAEIIDPDSGNIYGRHYFSKEIIKPNFEIPDRTIKNENDMKICLTFDNPEKIHDLFSNGIRQNVLYLGELLLNIGYDVYFCCNKKYDEDTINKLSYDPRFKFILNRNILSLDPDVVISIGYELTQHVLKTLKILKTKIISYNCGNNYIIDSECMLYNQHKPKNFQFNYIKKNDHIPYDVIWSIPQMTNTNQYYWATLFRTKCIEVPFIWSDKSIHLALLLDTSKTYDDYLYKKKMDEKKIVIFEPNISIMKWCGPALLACENAYRNCDDKTKIKQIFLNNLFQKDKDQSMNTFNMDGFTRFVNNLDLCSDGKINIEGRFNTLSFISTFADIAVSHQWENNLNYLYFDLAWMGWPIVHNASLCKDVGYYYDQFNYFEGGNKILECIENHDKNMDEYINKNRKSIDKYLASNKDLQQKYKNLINELFQPNENNENNENDENNENNENNKNTIKFNIQEINDK